jgi:type II secretory pathway pseudopilin PulG
MVAMRQRGFTVIELIALTLLLLLIGVVFWTQKTNIETAARDDKRKTSINAIYYALEEIYYPANKSYPRTLSESTLTSVDPKLLKDPRGVLINDAKSDYRYEAKNCTDDKCRSYSLRSRLRNEADYVKDSRNN